MRLEYTKAGIYPSNWQVCVQSNARVGQDCPCPCMHSIGDHQTGGQPWTGSVKIKPCSLGVVQPRQNWVKAGIGLMYLQLVIVAYGKLAWSFYLRLQFGSVLVAYGGQLIWSFYVLSTPPEIGFDLLCLRFPQQVRERNAQEP